MNNTSDTVALPSFPKKALLIALGVLLLQALFWVALFFTGASQIHKAALPELQFVPGQEILVKGLFDDDFEIAKTGQVLLPGMEIKTGLSSFVDIVWRESRLRLNENTTFVFADHQVGQEPFLFPSNPYLTFGLLGGNVWVNAREPIAIQGSQSKMLFAQSVGSFTLHDSLNRLMVLEGGVELELLSSASDPLNSLFIPFGHQVTFSDSQLNLDYAHLKPSKLKKELQFAPFLATVLSEDWFRQNRFQDAYSFAPASTVSPWVYAVKDKFFALQQGLSWREDRRHDLLLKRLDHTLSFLSQPDLMLDATEIDAILSSIDVWSKALNPSQLNPLFSNTFYRLSFVPSLGSADFLKTYLQERLVTTLPASFLRATLLQASSLMSQGEVSSALSVLQEWESHFDELLLSSEFEEFERQSQLFYALLLRFDDRLSSDFLALIHAVENKRLTYSDDFQELVFTLMSERLTLSAELLSSGRFDMAESFLNESSNLLSRYAINLNPSAYRVLFAKSLLLGEQITFSKESLHASAGGIDSDEFKDYLKFKFQDDRLSSDLKVLLEPDSLAISDLILPTAFDVVDRFNAARIDLDSNAATVNAENPFYFHVENARLLDLAPNGDVFTFDGVYDFQTDAVFDLEVNGEVFAGNFALKDLVLVLIEGQNLASVSPLNPELLSLLDSDMDEAFRAQKLAEDLAKALVINLLEKQGIRLSGNQPLAVLDSATLDLFRVDSASLLGFEDTPFSFDFDLGSQALLSAQFVNHDALLPSRILLPDLMSTVEQSLTLFDGKQMALQTAFAVLNTAPFSVDLTDLTLNDDDFNKINFKNLTISSLPLEVSGDYDLESDLFLSITHSLLTQENVVIEDYFATFTPLWVVNEMKSYGVVLGPDLIDADFPFDFIAVKDFSVGDLTLNFNLDFKLKQVKNIVLSGQASGLSSMSFESFSGWLETL